MDVKEVTQIVDNIEKMAGQPDKKALKGLEGHIKKSFEILKEGKAKFLFNLSSKQYNKGEIDIDRYWDILTENVRNEIEKGLILYALASSGPATPREISMSSGVPLNRMYWRIVSLLKDGEIVATGETEDSLIYSRGE